MGVKKFEMVLSRESLRDRLARAKAVMVEGGQKESEEEKR